MTQKENQLSLSLGGSTTWDESLQPTLPARPKVHQHTSPTPRARRAWPEGGLLRLADACSRLKEGAGAQAGFLQVRFKEGADREAMTETEQRVETKAERW